MSDAQEFLEQAANFEETPRKDRPEKCEAEALKQESTDLVQYFKNGPGFSPAGETLSKLKSGVYSIDSVNQQLTFVPDKIITDTLLRFPDSRMDLILKEIDNFWNLKEEFKNGNAFAHGGFIHKRGYLLFGPPGSGKTCLLKLVMQRIVEKGGIVLLGNIHPRNLTDGMKCFRKIEPDRSVVIIFEDFDTLLENYGESRYLSILDGEDSIDNALFLATTNYPSRLDARLYCRPGRFSDVVKIGMPSASARRFYLERMLKKHEDIETIIEKTDGFSLDHLKALVLGVYFEKKNLVEEIERLRILFKPIRDDTGNRRDIGLSSQKYNSVTGIGGI